MKKIVFGILALVIFIAGTSLHFEDHVQAQSAAYIAATCREQIAKTGETARECLDGMIGKVQVGLKPGGVAGRGVPVSHSHITSTEVAMAEQIITNERVATVNLPYGEKFVAFGPELGNIQTYITEKRPEGEQPRKLTIHRPGMTPLSWDVYLYIQEH